MPPLRTLYLLVLLVLLSSCRSIYPYGPKESVTDGGIEAGKQSDSDVEDARSDVVLRCEGKEENTPCDNPSIACEGQCVCCGGTCQRCALPNRRGSCVDGTCRSFECSSGWADCYDDRPGCETDITTDEDCGICGNAIGPDDPKNCGACGRSCEGGVCLMGRCQPVIIAQSDTFTDFHAMALFKDSVYLSECGTSSGIKTVEKTAETITIAQPLVSGVCALKIAVDDAGIFWMELLGIWRQDHAENQTHIGKGSNFDLDDSFLYLVHEQVIYQTSKEGGVSEQITEITDGQITRIVADSSDVYIRVELGTQGQILHWSPTSLKTLHTFEGSYGDLIIEGDYLYYSARTEGKIYQLNLQTLTIYPVYSDPLSSPVYLAADAHYLYWQDNDDSLEADEVRRKKPSDPPADFEEIWTAGPYQDVLKILVDDTRIFILAYGEDAEQSTIVKQIKPQ